MIVPDVEMEEVPLTEKELRLLDVNEAEHFEKNMQLRDYLNTTIEMKEASERGEDCVEETTKILEAVGKISADAKLSTTVWLDAQVLHNSSLVYKNCMEKISNDMSDYNSKEFTENILMYLVANSTGNRHGHWSVLESIAAEVINTCPGFSGQSGAVEVSNIERPVQRQTRTREHIVTQPAKQLKTVTALDEEISMEAQFRQLMAVLGKAYRKNNDKPISFYKFVLNPWSYGETMENIFTVSHLIKEGFVHFLADRSGMPVVKPVCDRQTGEPDFERKQVAITMDMKIWRKLVDAFEIETPMIPSRGDMSDKI